MLTPARPLSLLPSSQPSMKCLYHLQTFLLTQSGLTEFYSHDFKSIEELLFILHSKFNIGSVINFLPKKNDKRNKTRPTVISANNKLKIQNDL